jgi:hypothetical protein
MNFKTILFLFLVICVRHSAAQKILFSDSFENKSIDSSWQVVTGNWHIGDVQEMRIAPAEGGHQYVLCSGHNGNASDNMIRLIVDLPDSLQQKKITLSFYYYSMVNASGSKLEGEFYQKEIKDGLRGKPWSAGLPLKKGRWIFFQQKLIVPKKANSLRVVFYGLESSGKKDPIVCFDNILVSF